VQKKQLSGAGSAAETLDPPMSAPREVEEKAELHGTGVGPIPVQAIAGEKRDWGWVPLSELARWKKNPRKNDGAPVERVAESIKAIGFVAPIVVWTSRNEIRAGDTRAKALQLLLKRDRHFVPRGAPGVGVVPVRFFEFENEKAADLYAIADNRLNELATWDEKGVDEILKDYSDDDAYLVGFEDLEIKTRPELVVEELDTSFLTDLRFAISVTGPVPKQPDVLEKLRSALEKMPGVTVELDIG